MNISNSSWCFTVWRKINSKRNDWTSPQFNNSLFSVSFSILKFPDVNLPKWIHLWHRVGTAAAHFEAKIKTATPCQPQNVVVQTYFSCLSNILSSYYNIYVFYGIANILGSYSTSTIKVTMYKHFIWTIKFSDVTWHCLLL